ncbi:peptidoglycan-binding protein [Patescibacteria group bacterium]|nr:peptidoglycan-binding protein [Patescibacteria group bacterium]
MKKIFLLLFIIFIFSLFFSYAAQAQEPVSRNIGAGLTSKCTFDTKAKNWNCDCQVSNEVNDCQVGQLISDPVCACCGDCTLNNFLGLGVNLANIILKYLGVVALVLFIFGGVIWITSGGSSEKVQRGKKIISGSVIGMAIVIGAFLIIRVFTDLLGVEKYYLAYLETETQDKDGDKEGGAWPACPAGSTLKENIGRPWCYGCTWTGGAGRGCQSDEVKVYQGRLNALQCNCGDPDGLFGSQTKECTKRFQKAWNLDLQRMFEDLDEEPPPSLGVDGTVGEKTWSVYDPGGFGFVCNN